MKNTKNFLKHAARRKAAFGEDSVVMKLGRVFENDPAVSVGWTGQVYEIQDTRMKGSSWYSPESGMLVITNDDWSITKVPVDLG